MGPPDVLWGPILGLNHGMFSKFNGPGPLSSKGYPIPVSTLENFWTPTRASTSVWAIIEAIQWIILFLNIFQHLRRHDAKNESEVYFCLKCENTSFPDEREYVDHMEKCDPAWVFKTIKEGSSNNEDQLKYFFHFPRVRSQHPALFFYLQFWEARRFEEKMISQKNPKLDLCPLKLDCLAVLRKLNISKFDVKSCINEIYRFGENLLVLPKI